MSAPPTTSEEDAAAKKSLLMKAGKTLARKREKLKQKYSKADGSQMDEEFQILKANFEKQQTQAHRVVKDIQKYMKAVEGLVAASKSLGDSIKTVYEPDWPGSNKTYNSITGMDTTYQDMVVKLNDQFVEPMKSYLNQFPDIKKRVDKRDRRQLDHDRCKRAVLTARQKGSKKINELEDQFTNAQAELEQMNNEVFEVLPTFYDGRVTFYGQHFQTLFGMLHSFHETCALTANDLALAMDELFVEGGSPDERHRTRVLGAEQPLRAGEHIKAEEMAELKEIPNPTDDPLSAVPSMDINSLEVGAVVSTMEQDAPPAAAGAASDSSAGAAAVTTTPAVGAVPPPNPTSVLEHRIATHPYDGQDEDELTFPMGAEILVLPFPDPEDEEEGWLYGHSGGKEGVFPANFTAPKGT